MNVSTEKYNSMEDNLIQNVNPTISAERHKMKKIVNIDHPLKYAIQPCPGFIKKELASYHLELSGICEFGCVFCSTDFGLGTLFKIQTYRAAARSQYPSDFPDGDPDIHEFCKTYAMSYLDILQKIEIGLTGIDPEKTIGKTLMFGQLVDNFGPELMKEGITRRAMEMVLEKTYFRIRCLSKSTAVAHGSLMELYLEYPDRFIVGLSIGTVDDSLARKIEVGTSRPSARIKALHKLQDAGVKTYGMLCPVLKSAVDGLESLVDQINPQVCEHIWVESYNDRSNWGIVQKALGTDHPDYEWFAKAYGSKDTALWSSYTTELYTRIRDKAEVDGWISKLRYLLYEGDITESDAPEYKGHIARDVLLQGVKDKETGKSKNPAFADFDPGKPVRKVK